MEVLEERKWIICSYDDFTSWIEEHPQRRPALFQDILPFIAAAETREVGRWPGLYPVVRQGEPSAELLYILLDGNAFLFQTPEDFKTLIFPSTRLKTSLERGRLKQPNKLREVGDVDPFLLCQGDLIGEYELLESSPYLNTVILGLPFTLERRVPPSLVMRIRISQSWRDDAHFRHFIHTRRNRKIRAVQRLLLAKFKRSAEDQLAYILCLCFWGDLPTLQRESERLVLAPHKSGSESTEIHLPRQYLQALFNNIGDDTLTEKCQEVQNHGFNYVNNTGDGTRVDKFELRAEKNLAAVWAALHRKP